jgi:dUTP pyrophosphatase
MKLHLLLRVVNYNDGAERTDLENHYKEAIEKFNKSRNDPHRDSGFDLFLDEKVTNVAGVARTGPLVINHHVQCALYGMGDDGVLKPLPYYLYPRSSISKTPFRLANSVGIIDSGYRGNLIAKVDSVYDVDYEMDVGGRMFQVCAPNLQPFDTVTLVKQLEMTTRGSGGFGSTG